MFDDQRFAATWLTSFRTVATELNLHESLSGEADFQLFPSTIKFEAVTPETLRHFHGWGLRAEATQLSCTSVVPKVCSADPKGSANSSQGIGGYISVMATLSLLIF